MTSEEEIVELKEYINQLERALYQHGHVVDFGSDKFATEHPVECRRIGLWKCPVHLAVESLDGIPVEPGKYFVSLSDVDGVLMIGARV